MRSIKLQLISVWPILAVLLSLFFPSGAHGGSSAQKEEGCRGCHAGQKAKTLGLRDIYSEIESLKYRHPALDKGCSICHIATGIKRTRVWEVGSPYYQSETVLLLQGLSKDRTYTIEAVGKDEAGNRSKTQVVEVTPTGVGAAVENDNKPPVMISAGIDDLRQTAFLEATVRWETDEPSNALVEYGMTGKYGEKTFNERTFVRDHRIKMTGLEPARTYHYRITSRDIFGNVLVSQDYTLNTGDLVKKAAAGGTDKPGSYASKPRVNDVSVFKVKGTNDVFIQIASDEPVKVFLRINEPSEMDKHGFGLLPARESRIDACVKCHSQGASHPVGVRSRGNIRIPAGLPTIEGGMMTCVTCHDPHGGNREYLGRLDTKKDLCAACHSDR